MRSVSGCAQDDLLTDDEAHAQHQWADRKFAPRLPCGWDDLVVHFIIFGKTAGVVDPRQRTLNDPPLGQDFLFRLDTR